MIIICFLSCIPLTLLYFYQSMIYFYGSFLCTAAYIFPSIYLFTFIYCMYFRCMYSIYTKCMLTRSFSTLHPMSNSSENSIFEVIFVCLNFCNELRGIQILMEPKLYFIKNRKARPRLIKLSEENYTWGNDVIKWSALFFFTMTGKQEIVSSIKILLQDEFNI